ncbi:MAG: endonuclease/exonuclease/phosphatase family protein [Saprospiraceae bacterium]
MNYKIKSLLYILILLSSFSIYGQELKLMTYNIRLNVESDGINKWDNRKEFLTSQIAFYDPDIFGLQEAKPEQVTYIENTLPGYTKIGIGRDENGSGEASCLFYKNDRFDLLAQNTFWLSETPETISKGWDAAYRRICTYGYFYDKELKINFYVFNTHLDHIGEVARTKGIELILDKIKTINSDNEPVFLMGDFNSTPDSDRIITLREKMDDSRLISIDKPFGPDASFNGFQFNIAPENLIDYIFLNKNSDFIVKKYAILTDNKNMLYPSDHFPVFIILNHK